MAVKVKEEEKESLILKYLKEEHKWETYLLGFLSCLSIALGALILTDVLVVNANTWIIGDYPDVFGWVIEVIGIIGLILFIVPIFKPSAKEIKELTPPTRQLFFGNVVRVFLFITILALVFMLYEAFISAVLGKIL